MKKHLLLLIFAMIGMMLPQSAVAAIYNVNIDKAANVDFDIAGTIVSNAHDGDNAFDMGSERYLRVMAKPGVVFTEVTLIDQYYNEESNIMFQIGTENDRQYIDLSSSFPEDESWRIRTSAAADVRSASCTVTVDDPSRVRLVRKNSEELIELQAGVANEVKFDPSNEKELIITPVGDKPLYKVMCDDVEVKDNGYRYVINIKEGSAVDIQANYPDIDCKVELVFENSDAMYFIKTIDVDDKAFTDIKLEGTVINTKLGAGLEITGDTNNYEITAFTVNGKNVAFFNPFRLLIDGDTKIYIAVRRYASFDITINVDDPAKVHIYKGYSYNGIEYELKAGENTVEVLRATPIVSLVPAEGCYIATLSIGTDVYDPSELIVAPVMVGSLADNEVLNVTTATIVRDCSAMVYVQGLEEAKEYFKLQRADHSVVEGLAEGYNALPFYDRDNSFILTTGAPVASHVYVNDKAIDAEYPDAPTYRPVLSDSDVLKVFFGAAPRLYTVTVDIAPELAGDFSLKLDKIKDITPATFSALENTEVVISTTTDTPIEITLDGEPLLTDNMKFNVTANHNLKIEKKKGSGIGEVEIQTSTPVYYNMQGIRIENPAKGESVIRIEGAKASKTIIR